jgi:hypothetical protein
MSIGHSSLVAILLLLAGCQGAGDTKPVPGPPVSGVPASCERSCNSEYDACMDRFSAVPGAQRLGRPDDPTNMMGPNGVCPDQLKSCLKRCSL